MISSSTSHTNTTNIFRQPTQLSLSATRFMMSRPAPIDTQSSNAVKASRTETRSYLDAEEIEFLTHESKKLAQKPLLLEPQKQLSSVAIRPGQLEPPLRHQSSRHSLHPDDAQRLTRADSHRRSDSRDSRRQRERSRSPSRDSQLSRRRSISARSTYSFDSRYTRDELYRDSDGREYILKKDLGMTENDGIRYWWTNLYREDVFLGHFYCRPEPTLSPKNFFPGMIIWATHSVFQNDRRATPGDHRITFTDDVPVYTKSRPMVVLYSTHSGLYCTPMFSLSGNTRKYGWRNQRENEYISLAEEGDEWEGDTP
jgi:hypothetical protein